MLDTWTDAFLVVLAFLFSLTMQIGNWKERQHMLCRMEIIFSLYQLCMAGDCQRIEEYGPNSISLISGPDRSH